jgi:hypothetical protein
VVAGIGVATLIGAAILGDAPARRHSARPAASPATAPPSSSSAPDQPGVPPLRGVPLGTATGLRLLVANDPAPFLFDVDRGTTQPVTGLPTDGDPVVWVLPVGEDALVVSELNCKDCQDARVYRVRHDSTVATQLGTAMDVVAAGDGRAVWMLSGQNRTRCTLRNVALAGRPRQPDRPIPCTTRLVGETSAGLLIMTGSSADGSDWHSARVDPSGGITRFRFPAVQAVAGHGRLVLGSAEPDGPLTLAELRSGASYRLAWPSQLGFGIDEVRVHPNGWLVVVGFADPALPGGGQGLDEWLLDTTTRRWRQLPDMPADVALKFTSMNWTGDGRLVFLAQTADLGDVVAVWRPGQPRIAVRQVELPERSGGSDSFVVW